MKKTYSAGGVVVNPEGKILIVNQNHNSWSLPKGHVDRGEDELSAARREIYEESGIQDLTLIKDLGSYERHRIGVGGKSEDVSELKHIRLFLFRTNQTQLDPKDPANPEARWVSKEAALELLTHEKDKDFFKNIVDSLGL